MGLGPIADAVFASSTMLIAVPTGVKIQLRGGLSTVNVDQSRSAESPFVVVTLCVSARVVGPRSRRRPD
ncbi:MAG TPA: hypothetical protein VGK33_16020 [Chloroflexota bacterium]